VRESREFPGVLAEDLKRVPWTDVKIRPIPGERIFTKLLRIAGDHRYPFSDQMIQAILLIRIERINLGTSTQFPDMMTALENTKTLWEPSVENSFVKS
jgi:hypothetical protein